MVRLLTILKRVAFAIVVTLLFICVAVAIVFNFVLTPKRMTPVVERVIGEYLNTEISIGSVDFSLFSTLPEVSLTIDSLRIAQLADGVDDLFSVDRCRVRMTPQSLFERRVVINEVLLKKPSINLYVDSMVRPMSHFKIDSVALSDSDTTTSINIGDYRFRLDSIRVDSARFVIEDRCKEFYSSMDGFSAGVKLIMGPKVTMLKTDLSLDRFDVVLEDKTFSSNMSMSANSMLVLKRDSALLKIKETTLCVNGIEMKADGTLRGDKQNKCAYVDINSSLKTPSLVEFLNLVPSHIVNHKDSISTSGAVDLTLKVNGTYSATQYPDFFANIKVDKATARYGSNPVSFDQIDCDADMLIDLNNPTKSYAKINNLYVNTSGIIDLNVKGDVTNILESPYVDIDFDSDIDFDRIYEIVPLQDGVTLSGRNVNDLHTQFLLQDIQNSNYGNLHIDGESQFRRVKIDIDGRKFLNDSTSTTYFAVDIEHGNILFGERVRGNNSRTLLSTMNCSGFGFKDREGVYTSIKDVKVTMGANFDTKTKKVNGVGVNALMQSTSAGIEDEIDVDLGVTDMTLTISPKNEERDTKILAKISSESITAKEQEYNTSISTQRADFELNMLKEEYRKWYLDGWVGFRKFNMYSDLFPIDVALDRSRVTIDGNKIELKGTQIDMGESSFVATGYMTNIIRSLFIDPETEIEGQLSIKSPILNANELMDVTNRSVLMSSTESDSSVDSLAVASDSTGMMLLVPRGVKFDFDLNVDKVIYGETFLEKVAGEVMVNKGILSLDKLTFSTIGAKTFSSIKYYNVDKNNSNVFVNLNLKGAEIDRISELMPTVSQMMPMVKTLDGVVDFSLRAKTNIDKDLNIDFETLRATSLLSGRNLVLMDDETFDDVSKTLMFKNKERNIIDSVKVYVIADKSKFIVQPFEFTIDRYKMVIGGEQVVTPVSYDLDYNYNISILKSPLPFKAGVDIKGRNEDFDYKVTKAKLKNSDYAALKREYDAFQNSIKE